MKIDETSEAITTLTMLDRLKAAAPYNLFFNRISMSQETHKQQNCIEMKGSIKINLLCVTLVKTLFFRFIVSQLGKVEIFPSN